MTSKPPPSADRRSKGAARSGRGGSRRSLSDRLISEPQVRSEGSERSRWTEESRLPEIAPGTFDAAALLASVTESLRPVIDMQLEQIACSLAASVPAAEDGDLAAVIRTELTRRLVPQFTEAVRGAVVDGIRARQMHLAQLAVIDRAAHQASKLTSLQARIDHEITKAGLVRVAEPGDLSLFSLVNPDQDRTGDSEAPAYSVVAPAYTDRESGRVVEIGWLRVEDGDRPEDQPRSLTPRKKRQQHPDRERHPQAPPAPAKTQGALKKPHRKGPSARPGPPQPAAEGASGAAAVPDRPREDRTPDGSPLSRTHAAPHRDAAGNHRTK
ncbi:hypothetical protein AB0C76_17685 [Kitasatospora sp. NPDC048722]|uniref:hypothetical protein n=1 Tax=Kitasatospora sp. NPDC048722 TaxID=3155639 RepID=UPI0033DDB16C